MKSIVDRMKKAKDPDFNYPEETDGWQSPYKSSDFYVNVPPMPTMKVDFYSEKLPSGEWGSKRNMQVVQEDGSLKPVS